MLKISPVRASASCTAEDGRSKLTYITDPKPSKKILALIVKYLKWWG